MWYKFSQNQQILPPVHDGCKCYIETMPAGNKIWQFAPNCCEQCRQLGVAFNQEQNSALNQPAQLNPQTPEPPAVLPEEEGEVPEVPEVTTQNYMYTPTDYTRIRK